MLVLDVEALAAEFPIGRPRGDARLVSGRPDWPAWRVETSRGAFFVKRMAAGDWQERLDRGMAFEQAAAAAGISMPAPVMPSRPAFGLAAHLAGLGFVRVHDWVDARPLDGDDVSQWLGRTMACMHRIEPVPRARPDLWWYGLHPPQDWERWLAAGERSAQPWAGLLRENLARLQDLVVGIERAFGYFGGFAVTHPDVEPWNVAIAGDCPVLMDWDFAGPDSCALTLAHAALNFAMVQGQADPGRIGRTVRAYREAGGAPLGDGPGLLARRLGMMLSRLAERLRVSIGEESSLDADQARSVAATRLRELPAFAARLERWAALFPRG